MSMWMPMCVLIHAPGVSVNSSQTEPPFDEARTDEIDSLKKAKDILSGADYSLVPDRALPFAPAAVQSGPPRAPISSESTFPDVVRRP